MLESTKKALETIITKEKEGGDKELAIFLERMKNDEVAVVAEIHLGFVENLVGAPFKWATADFDICEPGMIETAQLIGCSPKEGEPPKATLERALDQFEVETTNPGEPKRTILSLMIPSRDYADLKKAIKRAMVPTDIEIIGREYTARTGQYSASMKYTVPRVEWTIYDKAKKITTITMDSLEPVTINLGNVHLILTVEPDPTYE